MLVKLEICPNPCCDCDEVTLDVFDGQRSVEECEHRVTVDPQKKIRKVRKDSTADPLSLRVVESLTEDDWRFLSECYLHCKTQNTLLADPEEIKPAFSLANVMSGGLVYYREVLPYQMPVMVDIEGKGFEVIDLYCVKPSCKCNEVNLMVQSSEHDGGLGHESDDALFTTVKLRTGKYEIREPGALDVNLPTFMKAVLTKDNMAIFSERYNNMRQWFKNYAAALPKQQPSLAPAFSQLPDPFANPVSAGRNDPCPCGSGKKYKKCCGR